MKRIFDLWRRVAPEAATRTPDVELLTRFVRHRDEAAFAELVDRHGPLVYAACRRLLPDPLDAEDAFQATFLVLVRRAVEVAGRPLGPWLHRVAVWTARNLRRRNAGRLATSRPLDGPELPPSLPDTAAADARLDVDAALSVLPHKYRVPLVLCHLQGWSRREAAEHLGCPESTLASLLSRGLGKLRKRLAGRDPAIVLAIAGSAAVPAGLSASAVRAAVLFHTGSLSAAATPAVADLTKGVLRMFWVKKLATAAVVVAAAAMIGLGAWLGSDPGRRAAAQPPAPDDPKARQERLDRDIQDLKAKIDALEREKKRLADEAAAAEGLRRLARAAQGGRLELTVGTGPILLDLKEYGPDERVRLQVYPADADALKRYLTRAHNDPAGPRQLVVVFDREYTAAKAQELLAACKAAGYDPQATVKEPTVKPDIPVYEKKRKPDPQPLPKSSGGDSRPKLEPVDPAKGPDPNSRPKLPDNVPDPNRPAARQPYVIEPPDFLRIEVTIQAGDEYRPLPGQPISGQFVVRPDGTIGLGVWGSVSVSGLTLPAAADAIRKHVLTFPALKDKAVRPESVAVCLDVLAYNSKAYYVIVSDPNGETVHRFPITGSDTVLDAIANVKGLATIAPDAQIFVARPGEEGNPHQLLPVDWKGITQGGNTSTNYQLRPGDRVYVKVPPPVLKGPN
jgi:RNA polymerase sigma factor (sigma-70 family)